MVVPIVFVCVLFFLNIPCYVSQSSATGQEGDLSFLALLTSQEPGVRVVCSGTIVHESFVLTAASCFYSRTGKPISYHHNVLIASDYKDIRRLIPHPLYFLETWANNVGLIQLAEKVVFGPLVSRMKLAQSDELQVDTVGQTVCWDLSDKKSGLQRESVTVAPRRHCGRPPYYGRYITDGMVCATADEAVSCSVDSGAPLLKGGRQHGIASLQFGSQVIFTKTIKYRYWIATTVLGDQTMQEYFAGFLGENLDI